MARGVTEASPEQRTASRPLSNGAAVQKSGLIPEFTKPVEHLDATELRAACCRKRIERMEEEDILGHISRVRRSGEWAIRQRTPAAGPKTNLGLGLDVAHRMGLAPASPAA